MTMSNQRQDREFDKFRESHKGTVVAVSLEKIDYYTSYSITRGTCGRIDQIDYYYDNAYLYSKTFTYDANNDLVGMSKMVLS